MKRLTAFVLGLIILLSCSGYCAENKTEEIVSENSNVITIFCAPDGNDGAAGTKDEPLATLNGARKKVAELKQKHKNAPITVYFRGGEYKVDRTTTFSKGDSGTKEAPVKYAAYDGETPVFSGSVRLPVSGFEALSAKDLNRVPEEARAYVGVFDLKKAGIKSLTKFVGYDGTEYIEKVKNTSIVLLHNDKEQTAAQWPNGIDNFIKITDFASDSDITVDSEGRIRNWTTAENAMLCGWMKSGYSFSRVEIADIYPEENRIVTKYDVPRGISEEGKWQISNLLEELDVPGEYYVDSKELKVYYYPPYKDENADIELIANESNMISLNDASYITFEGLSFKNNRADAVEARNCNNLSFLGCEFKNIELMAVDTQYCTDITVDGCDFVNIGSTGVRFDERNGGYDALSVDVASVRLDLSPDNNVVNNCYFWDVATQSVIYTGAVRVHGVGNKVTNCTMHEARSSFIHHGGNDIKITNNEIYNGVKTSKDMGMIYNGRNVTQRGNETAYNYFHDWNTTMVAWGYAHAIYDDDNLGGNYKHHNFFVNGEKGIQNSGSPESRVDYNIFVKNQLGAHIDAQGAINNSWLTSMQQFVNRQVPQVYTLKEYEKYSHIKELFFKNIWPEIGVTFDGNLFFENDVDHEQNSIAMEYIDFSTNIYADESYKEYFNNPDGGDYTLKKDIELPEELKELQKIQLEDIGIYKSETRDKTEYNLGEFKAYYPANYSDDFDGKHAYFAWEKSENADEYIFELAEDAEFKNILKTETCPFNYAYFTDLEAGENVYWWRVTAVSKALKNPETKMCENGAMVFRTNKYDMINTTALAAQIEKTAEQAAAMTEGDGAGKVAVGTIDRINNLISEAKQYLKMKKGSQNLVDQTTERLKNEVDTAYEGAKIYRTGLSAPFESGESGWVVGDTARFVAKDGTIEVKSSSPSVNATAAFPEEKITFDSIKSFKIKPTVPELASSGTWQAISFLPKDQAGKKVWSSSEAQSLLIVIKYDTVELQIRDGISPAKVISVDSPLVQNEWNDVSVGIIDFGLTQRCILEINGKTVVDYINTDMPIKSDLYFALYDAPAVIVGDGTSGISAALGEAAETLDNSSVKND